MLSQAYTVVAPARLLVRPAHRGGRAPLRQHDAVGGAPGDREPARTGRADQDRRRLRPAGSRARRRRAGRACRCTSSSLAAEQRADRADRLLQQPEPVGAGARRSGASSCRRRGRTRRSGGRDAGAARPASSIATIAGLRTAAGSSPTPTWSRSVTASAVAASVSPPERKQSSASHSSSKPSRSASRANAGSDSGGHCGLNITPIRVMPAVARYAPAFAARSAALCARLPAW